MTCHILFLYHLDAELMYVNLKMSPLERISEELLRPEIPPGMRQVNIS